VTPLEQLARARVEVLGVRQYGPYQPGRYDTAARLRNAREELADLFAYAVLFDRVERPANEAERYAVRLLCERLWAALDAQAGAPRIESPGEPECGEPA